MTEMTNGDRLQEGTRPRCLVHHNLVPENAPKTEDERLKVEEQEYTIADNCI